MRKLWAFWCKRLLLSLPMSLLPPVYFLHHVSRPEFKNSDFSRQFVAYFVSFDSPIWTLKYDIIRGSYEISYVSESFFLSLRHCSHNFTFSFMSLALNFTTQILSFHAIAYFVRFDSPIRTLKSDIIQVNYELSNATGALVYPYVIAPTTLLFPSCLSPWISQMWFYQFMS